MLRSKDTPDGCSPRMYQVKPSTRGNLDLTSSCLQLLFAFLAALAALYLPLVVVVSGTLEFGQKE